MLGIVVRRGISILILIANLFLGVRAEASLPKNIFNHISITRVGNFTVTGNTPAPATNVTVNGNTAERYGDYTFARTNNALSNPNNTFTIVAKNAYGLTVTNTANYNLPTPISLAYDANGNITNDGLKSFSYDPENQLTTNWVPNAWKSEFVYDGFGRRRITRDYTWQSGAWVKTNEVRQVYDGLLPMQERDANNNPLVTYTRGLDLSGSIHGAGGIGGLLARTDAAGSTFYHADGIGNVTAMMDGNGDVVARYLYNPFGKLVGKWGAMADANTMRFSSKEEVRGLYYYGFRFYDPNPQRWLNQDPLGEAGGLNLYGYVHNSPLNSIDPFGLVEPRFNPVAGLVDAGISVGKGAWALLGIAADTIAEEIYPAPWELSNTELYAPHGIFFPPNLGNTFGMYDNSFDPRWGDVAEGLANAALLALPCKGLKGSGAAAAKLTRSGYVSEVEALKDLANTARSAGQSAEATARLVSAERNALKIKYRELSPADFVKQAEARNIEKYGNPLGPTVDQLRAQGKTWEQIIDSSARAGGKDLGL